MYHYLNNLQHSFGDCINSTGASLPSLAVEAFLGSTIYSMTSPLPPNT